MQFIQRDGDSGDFAFQGQAARLLRDGRVVMDWTTGGVLKDIPVGGGYTVEIRQDGVVTTDTLAVGVVVFALGQSNMNGWFETPSAATPDPDAYVWNSGGWQPAAGTGALAFAKPLTDSGIPVAFVVGAVHGSPLLAENVNSTGYWLAEGSNTLYGWAKSKLDAAGGQAEYTLWLQGESDAGPRTTAAEYAEGLNTLFDRVQSDIDTTFLIGGLAGRVTTDSSITAAYNRIRGAQAEVAASRADTLLSPTPVDTELQDTVHLTRASRVQQGTDMAETLLDHLGLPRTVVARGTATAGNDSLTGGAGADTLSGLGGHDILVAGAGADLLLGGAGDDLLRGQAGADTLQGGSGQDVLSGGADGDLLLGEDGDDDLWGDAGNDTLEVGQGDDLLQGGEGDDVLRGGAGNNRLDGGVGSDTMTGGMGDDVYVVGSTGDVVTAEAADGGRDRVETVLSRYTLGANIEDLTLTYLTNALVKGNELANRITGNVGNNTLSGLAGADTLDGGDGNDTADYAASNAAVRVSLATGAGTGGHAQGDVLTAIENLIGSAYGDWLEGNGGANTLAGLAGADTLNGGAGSDTADYAASNAAVQVSLATGAGTGGHAQGDVLTAIENLSGSKYGDRLEGNGGANILAGLAGADTLNGGAGNDTADYAASDAAVRVSLATGAGTGGQAQGDALIAIENLAGSAYGDWLEGNAGANLLSGQVGDDTLLGGGGQDTLEGGAGTDLAVFDGRSTEYQVSRVSGGFLVNGHGSVARLSGIEWLRFDDDEAKIETFLNRAPPNQAPEAGTDGFLMARSTTLRLDAASLLANDTDADGNALSVVAVGNASRGSVTLDGGTVSFTPTPGQIGEASFSYTLSDGHGGTATGLARVAVATSIGSSGAYFTGGAAADVFDVSFLAARAMMTGGAGNDTLLGGAGNDALNGGDGDDLLSGGAGSDTLIDGLGADRLTGGAGSDVFQFQASTLRMGTIDRILDFEGAGLSGGDTLRLSGFGSGARLVLLDTTTEGLLYEVRNAAGAGMGQLLVSMADDGARPLGAGDYILS